MKINKKTISIIIFSLIIAGGIVYFAVREAMDFNEKRAVNEADQTGQKQAVEEKNQDNANIEQKEITTKVASGTVASVIRWEIAVNNKDGGIKIVFNPKTYFYSIENGKAERRSIVDIKKGTKIAVEYDEADKTALSVRIDK